MVRGLVMVAGAEESFWWNGMDTFDETETDMAVVLFVVATRRGGPWGNRGESRLLTHGAY
jgi:hypothetical protein